jgi:predicted nucleotidyltransferase component of viral defense system
VKEEYRRTVELLLDITPLVFRESEFAMKGGTAINLFVQDLPRLSVDIDLVFVPKETPRDEALERITAALTRIQAALTRGPGVTARLGGVQKDEAKLFVSRGRYQVKVEVNTVFRGTVYPVLDRTLAQAATDYFKREVHIKMLDSDEVYGSKLVAAMDRQHPRDLFDVMMFLNGGGITTRMRRAFVIYVAGHNRPIGELLTPNPQPLDALYNADFVGLTQKEVALADLLEVRTQLFRELPASLDADERRFLVSIKQGQPDWALLGIPGIEQLPALQWKLTNVRRLQEKNRKKYDEQLAALREKLGV